MRNVRREKPRSLAGSLLVAHPNMLDPNFRRAVLFISAHDPEDGAIGVIVNRPLDKSVDCAKAQPFGVKIRAPVATLVRHYESARPLVSHACGRAGRSVAQLSDRFRMFYLVTGHSSLITC